MDRPATRASLAAAQGPLHTRGPLRVALAVSLLGGLLACGISGAQADPGTPRPDVPSQQQVDEAKARTALASGKVEDLDGALDAADARLAALARTAGVAAEKANAARLELDRRAAAARAAQLAADAAAAERTAAQGSINALAAQLWMAGGSLDGLEILVSASGTTTVADRAAGLDLLTSYRGSVLTDATRTSVRAADTHRAAAAARVQQEAASRQADQSAAAARAEAASAAVQKEQIEQRQRLLLTELATLRRTSLAIEQQRRAALQAEAARAAAEAAARAAAEESARRAEEAARRRTPPAPAPAPAPAPRPAPAPQPAPAPAPRPAPAPAPAPGPVPAPRGSAATAIAFARAQLGKPYVWGGEGPAGFDCSGLTKMAWAAAGVSLTHQTNWQWAETAHVPLESAQPGDLIFYGQVGGDIYHVGLYLGGGQMIHAPTFGAPVKIQSIYFGDLIGYAGRVR